MRIKQVTIANFRGWQGPIKWLPGEHDVLVAPNNSGKSALLRAVDIALNPHWNPYRDLMEPHDFFDLDTSTPVEFTIVLAELNEEDRDVFELLEGQRPALDGDPDHDEFGLADSPDEEFDQGGRGVAQDHHLHALAGDRVHGPAEGHQPRAPVQRWSRRPTASRRPAGRSQVLRAARARSHD